MSEKDSSRSAESPSMALCNEDPNRKSMEPSSSPSSNEPSCSNASTSCDEESNRPTPSLCDEESNRPTPSLRAGEWTKEETDYAARAIQFFEVGVLDAPEGTILSVYLSEKLHCSKIRISRKFPGRFSGKPFKARLRSVHSATAIDNAQVCFTIQF